MATTGTCDEKHNIFMYPSAKCIEVGKYIYETLGGIIMGFSSDNGGIAISINDAKLIKANAASTWNTRLSQIGTPNLRDKKVIICTYSLPNLAYSKRIFDKRSSNVTLIVNEAFKDKAEELQNCYPDLVVRVKKDVHAKMVLIEPKTVWLSSANFGESDWFEQTIGLHSEEAYQFYLNQIEEYLNNK